MRRDLSTIDRDIGQDWSRIIQEAFKHGIDCDIIHGGLIAGKSEQGIHEVSTVQNYLLGTRRITPDGRVFRYGKCGADLGGTKWGVKSFSLLVTEKATIVSACAAGATSLTVTFDGDFWDTAIAANELRGGYISLYNSANIRDQRMIISNTAVEASGGVCIIGIDAPIVAAVGSAFDCEILANPYSDLRVSGGGGEWTSVVGLPAALATTGQYFWIQTWGPFRVTPVGAELGVGVYERYFFFDANGSLVSAQVSEATTRSYQPAGFIIERTDGGVGSAAPFIMLQISP